MNSKKYMHIIDHYENCLEKHGDSHLGVDWPKQQDVNVRYQVMLEVIRKEKNTTITLLDFGCGLSHLFEYILRNKSSDIEYAGLDASEKYVNLCRKKYPDNAYYCIDMLEEPERIPLFDYIVMNGVFTVKRDLSSDEMFTYLKKLVSIVFHKCNTGLAFNVMSKAVDWERDDLFHLSTDLLIDFMSKELSRNFIIRNDYGLYEYTVYLYK